MPSWNSRGLRGSMLEEALKITKDFFDNTLEKIDGKRLDFSV